MATLVRHVMGEAPKSATPDMDAYNAAGLMANYDVGVIPVADEDELIGLVTDRDLVLRVLASREDPKAVRLGDIATRANLVTVTPDMGLGSRRGHRQSHAQTGRPLRDPRGTRCRPDACPAPPEVGAPGDAPSESQATIARNEGGPDPGTPDRVKARSGSAS